MKKIFRRHFLWLKNKIKDSKNRDRPNQGSQAYRIICRFGGIKELHYALGLINKALHIRSYYRWLNRPNGTVPVEMLDHIIYVARFVGVLLTEQDLDPRVQLSDEEAKAYHEAIGVLKISDVPKDIKEARKAALIKELYEKEKAGKIRSEEEKYKDRQEYMKKYRKMQDAAKKHLEQKRANKNNAPE